MATLKTALNPVVNEQIASTPRASLELPSSHRHHAVSFLGPVANKQRLTGGPPKANPPAMLCLVVGGLLGSGLGDTVAWGSQPKPVGV